MDKMKKELLKTVRILKKRVAHGAERPIFVPIRANSTKWN
jgi:hypothetical protein